MLADLLIQMLINTCQLLNQLVKPILQLLDRLLLLHRLDRIDHDLIILLRLLAGRRFLVLTRRFRLRVQAD